MWANILEMTRFIFDLYLIYFYFNFNITILPIISCINVWQMQVFVENAVVDACWCKWENTRAGSHVKPAAAEDSDDPQG